MPSSRTIRKARPAVGRPAKTMHAISNRVVRKQQDNILIEIVRLRKEWPNRVENGIAHSKEMNETGPMDK
jgi:hypothetical protein